jgi:hypothetical protein
VFNNGMNEQFLLFASKATKRLKKLTKYVDHVEGTAKPSKIPFHRHNLKFPTTHVREIEEWEVFIGTYETNPSVKDFVTDAVSSTKMFIYTE